MKLITNFIMKYTTVLKNARKPYNGGVRHGTRWRASSSVGITNKLMGGPPYMASDSELRKKF